MLSSHWAIVEASAGNFSLIVASAFPKSNASFSFMNLAGSFMNGAR
jgi:hypothetical protein